MRRVLGIQLAAFLAAGCSSTQEQVDESENYEGRYAAAVAPIADRRPGRPLPDSHAHTHIQQSIQRELDRSGVFAGVVSLDQRGEGNEAEVIIEPTLLGLRPSGPGEHELTLKVRVTEKTAGRTVLNEVYDGRCRGCAASIRSDGTGGSVDVSIEDLEEDLADRYGT